MEKYRVFDSNSKYLLSNQIYDKPVGGYKRISNEHFVRVFEHHLDHFAHCFNQIEVWVPFGLHRLFDLVSQKYYSNLRF